MAWRGAARRAVRRLLGRTSLDVAYVGLLVRTCSKGPVSHWSYVRVARYVYIR